MDTSTYKTVWQIIKGHEYPSFATLEDAEAWLKRRDCIDSGLTAESEHPDGLSTRYWVDLYDLPDEYSDVDIENCVGEGDSCPQIEPVAVPLDFEPDDSATAPRHLPIITINDVPITFR